MQELQQALDAIDVDDMVAGVVSVESQIGEVESAIARCEAKIADIRARLTRSPGPTDEQQFAHAVLNDQPLPTLDVAALTAEREEQLVALRGLRQMRASLSERHYATRQAKRSVVAKAVHPLVTQLETDFRAAAELMVRLGSVARILGTINGPAARLGRMTDGMQHLLREEHFTIDPTGLEHEEDLQLIASHDATKALTPDLMAQLPGLHDPAALTREAA